MSHVLVHFQKQEKYTVHPDASLKLKLYKKYQFNFPEGNKSNWMLGVIMLRGIFTSSCQTFLPFDFNLNEIFYRLVSTMQ